MNLDEFFREEEAKRIAETRAELAKEKAAWDALTPEQRRAEIERAAEEYAANWGALRRHARQ